MDRHQKLYTYPCPSGGKTITVYVSRGGYIAKRRHTGMRHIIRLLRFMGRDLVTLAAELGALISFTLVAVAASGITSAATPAEAADAWSFGLAALCWLGICTVATQIGCTAQTKGGDAQ